MNNIFLYIFYAVLFLVALILGLYVLDFSVRKGRRYFNTYVKDKKRIEKEEKKFRKEIRKQNKYLNETKHKKTIKVWQRRTN